MSVVDGGTMYNGIGLMAGTAMADTGTAPDIERAVGTGQQIRTRIADMAVGNAGYPRTDLHHIRHRLALMAEGTPR